MPAMPFSALRPDPCCPPRLSEPARRRARTRRPIHQVRSTSAPAALRSHQADPVDRVLEQRASAVPRLRVARTRREEAFPRSMPTSLGGNGVINFGCYRPPGLLSSTHCLQRDRRQFL